MSMILHDTQVVWATSGVEHADVLQDQQHITQAFPLPTILARHPHGHMMTDHSPSGRLLVRTCEVGSHICDERGADTLEGDGD